jgi:hypothetical protein
MKMFLISASSHVAVRYALNFFSDHIVNLDVPV